MKDSKLLNMFDQGHIADGTSSQPLNVAYNRYVCTNNPQKSSLRLLFYGLKMDSEESFFAKFSKTRPKQLATFET
jgi:hypothetical protein